MPFFRNSKTTILQEARPTAPSGFVAVADKGFVRINLNWIDEAKNETGYVIERSTDGVGWTVLDTVDANQAYYNDYTVSDGTQYYYRVRATNRFGKSKYSEGGNDTSLTPSLRANFSASDVGYSNTQVLDTEAEGVLNGQLTVVEIDGTLALVDRRMRMTAQVTAQQGDLGVYSGAITRETGIALFGEIEVGEQTAASAMFNVQAAASLAFANRLVQLNLGPTDKFWVGMYDTPNGVVRHANIEAYLDDTTYEICVVVGGYNSSGAVYRTGETVADYSYGYSAFARGGNFLTWTRIWADWRNNTSPIYWAFLNLHHTGDADNLAVTDVDHSDVLLATDYESSPAASTTFDHTANFLATFVVDTLPSANNIDIFFRVQDASNYWIIRISSAGDLSIVEVVAGTPTTRDTSAAAISNGEPVGVLVDGEYIGVMLKDGAATEVEWGSAANFKTETSGEVDSLGTGGAISDLSLLPRTSDSWETQLIHPDIRWNQRATVLEAGGGGNLHEVVVMYDSNPQILTGSHVYKAWYSNGWSPSDIDYAESYDGLSWTKYGSNPILVDYTRPSVFRESNTYHMYVCAETGTKRIDYYTSTDGITWALDTASAIALGVASWDDTAFGNNFAWKEGPNDWYMLYEATAAPTNWQMGLATSSDGKSWNKSGSNPVVDTSMRWLKKVGNTYHAWAWENFEGASTTPTDGTRYTSTDLISWTRHPDGKTLRRRFVDEGCSAGVGSQISDLYLNEVGDQVWIYFSATAVQGTDMHIKRAVFDGTIEELIAT